MHRLCFPKIVVKLFDLRYLNNRIVFVLFTGIKVASIAKYKVEKKYLVAVNMKQSYSVTQFTK